MKVSLDFSLVILMHDTLVAYETIQSGSKSSLWCAKEHAMVSMSRWCLMLN